MMLIILIIVCYIFTSCQDKQRQEIARLVQEWQGKEIVFPSHLVFTRYAKDTIWHDWQQADLKVFVYVDSVGCTNCKLQLHKWRDFISYIDSISGHSIPFIFVFQPKNIKELQFILKRDRFDYPVFVDYSNKFDQLNKFRSELMSQTFLLNRENQVEVIGNPILNLSIRDLYVEQIKTDLSIQKPVSLTSLDIDTIEFDLCTVPLVDIREQVVHIRNIGNVSFRLKGFTTSCDCTEAKCNWSELSVGQEGDMVIHFKAEQTGDFFRTIDIYGNVPNQCITLRLNGRVE